MIFFKKKKPDDGMDKIIKQLEEEVLKTEIGSEEWEKKAKQLAIMYDKRTERDKNSVDESKDSHDTWRTILKLAGDALIAVGAATLAHKFEMENIREISLFEKDDSYTGRKSSFLPKKK